MTSVRHQSLLLISGEPSFPIFSKQVIQRFPEQRLYAGLLLDRQMPQLFRNGSVKMASDDFLPLTAVHRRRSL